MLRLPESFLLALVRQRQGDKPLVAVALPGAQPCCPAGFALQELCIDDLHEHGLPSRIFEPIMPCE